MMLLALLIAFLIGAVLLTAVVGAALILLLGWAVALVARVFTIGAHLWHRRKPVWL